MLIKKQLAELLRYGLWGTVSTGINLALFYLLVFAGLQYIVANAVSYVAAVLTSYYFNRKFVFTNQKGKDVWKLMRYLFIRTFSIVIDSGLLVLLHEQLGMGITSAKIADSVLVISLTFIFSKIWVFRVNNFRKETR